MSLSIDTSKTKRRMARFLKDLERAQKAAMYEIGQEIMADSQENFVPVDLGTLKNTGHVEPPKVVAGQVTVRLGYGGPAAPYALAVHEHLSSHSPRSWRAAEDAGNAVEFTHGGVKYLETPVVNRRRTFARDLRQKLKARTAL